ncbi:unnamed protein product [Leptidea sinapis]|uniref:Down syndrome cell adhesion molecule n=1 Tax=Leptidea sinapis TaxID=189913 RepID=A0A5E4QA86_9NEOP|nr:unnamed protein product [Leptidea sinapis]
MMCPGKRIKRDLSSSSIIITQSFGDKIVTPGDDISLHCTATGSRPPRFIWERDGIAISSNTDSRYILGQMMSSSGVGVISHLNISRSRVEDGGIYTCMAYESDSSIRHSARVDVYGPPYIRTLPPIKVQGGDELKLRCPYYGYPISKLEWEHKGKKIISSIFPQHTRYKRYKNKKRRKRQILDSSEDGVLNLPRVMKEENGEMYTCIVYSPSGEMARRSFEIQVVEAPELDELRVGSGLKEGQIVQITCNIISGDPPIFFSWLKDGMKIPASLKVTERSSELFSVLIIKRVALEHCGKYTCIATNHVGKVNQTTDLYINEPVHFESMGTNLTTKVAMSLTLTCKPLGDNPIRIKWSLNGNPIEFTSSRQEIEVRQSIELRDLQPASEYRARVASGNIVDISPYTIPVHFATLQEAPSSSPLNVQAQQTDNPGELFVTWLPPAKEAHNGRLQGYHVKAVPRIAGELGPNDTQTKMIKVISRNGKQETLMSGLLKNTRYAVSVSAFNSAGNGPFSLAVYQTTREGAPESAPSSVECRGVSSTSIRVAWQHISDHGTSLLGYTLHYSNDDGPWLNMSSPHTEVYLQNLSKYQNYTIKVAGFSNYGVGPFSYPVICSTLQDVPGPPAAIKAVVSSATSITVSWKRPDQPNGDITHYTLYIKPVSSTSAPQSYRIDSDASNSRQLSFPVQGLVTGTQYEVFVRAHTLAGEGTPSDRFHIEPSSKVVAGVSSLGGTVSAGVGSSLLLHCECVGSPTARTVWYHNHILITHHPRFTRNHDDSLLINSYNLTWKESNGMWQDAWSDKGTSLQGTQEFTLQGLKCGTKYSLRMTASNSVGESQPAYVDATTLGGIPIAPSTTEWFWSNATHIYIQLSGWDENGCEIIKWVVDYREYGKLYEISPYAQFAIGFRTFGHVDNQEAPRMHPTSSKRFESGEFHHGL